MNGELFQMYSGTYKEERIFTVTWFNLHEADVKVRIQNVVVSIVLGSKHWLQVSVRSTMSLAFPSKIPRNAFLSNIGSASEFACRTSSMS